MRSELQPASQPTTRSYPFVRGVVQAVADIAGALTILGDLIASKTHTVKKTDYSEPPDVAVALRPA